MKEKKITKSDWGWLYLVILTTAITNFIKDVVFHGDISWWKYLLVFLVVELVGAGIFTMLHIPFELKHSATMWIYLLLSFTVATIISCILAVVYKPVGNAIFWLLLAIVSLLGQLILTLFQKTDTESEIKSEEKKE